MTGASVLTQFPRSFGLGGTHTPLGVHGRPVLIVVSGVACHIGPTKGNQPSDRWTAAFKFRTAANGVVDLTLDYVNGRSSPMHITSRTSFKYTYETLSDYSAARGKGFLLSFDYVPN